MNSLFDVNRFFYRRKQQLKCLIALIFVVWLVSICAPLHAQSLSTCRVLDGAPYNPAGSSSSCSVFPNQSTGWIYSNGNFVGSGNQPSEAALISATLAGIQANSGANNCGARVESIGPVTNQYSAWDYGRFLVVTSRSVNVSHCLRFSGVATWIKNSFGFNAVGRRTVGCIPPFDTYQYYDSAAKTNFCATPLTVETPPVVNSCQAGSSTPNPIIPATGEKLKVQTDYSDAGLHPLNFTRHYRTSNTPLQGTQGLWRHSHWARLAINATDNTAQVTFADGRGSKFSRSAAGQPWTSLTTNETLTILAAGELNFSDQDGRNSWIFDASGKLVRATQSNGWVMRYIYNAYGQLEKVINQFDRQLLLSYNPSGQLVQILPPDGNLIRYEYDSASRLSVVRYADASVRTYVYELTALPNALTGIVDENNTRLETYTYDALGRATSSEQIGGIERYSVVYPATGADATQVTDPLGTTRSYNYSTNLNRLAVTGADKPSGQGGAASRVQNSMGLLDSETDYLGVQTQYTWDTTRRLPLSTTQAQGRPEAKTTDTQWHPSLQLPVLVTEKAAGAAVPLRSTAYTYDSRGNRLSEAVADITSGITRTRTWAYNTLSLVVSETAPNGATTTYSYNSAGNPSTVRNALGHTTTYAYDGAGRVTLMTAPTGMATAYTYDLRGRLLTQTQSAGTGTATTALVTTYAYTPAGQLAATTLPSGHAISYTYDAAQRLTGWQDNRGASGVYTLDAMGNRTVEQVKNSAGQVVWQLARSINALNRVASETVGAAAGTVNNNLQTTYGFDANASVVSETNALAQTTQYGLDGLKRLSAITDAANATANLAYNALDAVTTATDFKGAATQTPRDALGNATSTTSADAGAHSAIYDALGLPSQLVDALNQATTITRDRLGRPTSITHADGRSTTLRYDLTGTTFNATGFPNASKGALSEIADTTDITKYQRDGFGRVIKKTQQLTPFTGTGAAPSRSVQYAYVTATAAVSVPGAGQLARLTNPNNNQLNYLYTPAGQISQLNWGSNPLVTSITYTPLGQPSSWNWEFADANATTSLPASRVYDTAGRVIQTELGSYTYDAAGRITSMSQQLYIPANASPSSTAVTATTVQYTIGYDALGRITSFTQLPSATIGTGTASISLAGKQASFTYDANGNRLSSIQVTGTGTGAVTTSRSYTVQAAGNRLLGFSQTITAGTVTAGASSNVTHTYDANGSLINDGLRSYEYDAGNRLAASTVGATDASPTTRYVHNVLGQRLFKTEPLFPPAPGDENDPTFMASLIAFFTQLWGPAPTAMEKLGFTYYYDEAGSLISEIGSGGAASTGNTQYVYLPTPGGPMPVAVVVTGKHYAVHADHLNTPRRLTQSDKKVTWQWAYSAFGDEQPVTARNRFVDPTTTPNMGSTTVADVTFNLRYPGQYFDRESGLSYNGMRSYWAGLGRYTQSDPVDLEGGWNKFGYVSGNPLSFTDPDGQQLVCTGIGRMRSCMPFPMSNPAAPGFEPGMPVETPGTSLPSFTLPVVSTVVLAASIATNIINACVSAVSNTPTPTPEQCKKYWDEANFKCKVLIEEQENQDIGRRKRRPIKGITGGYYDIESCARGLVPEACGGNKVER